MPNSPRIWLHKRSGSLRCDSPSVQQFCRSRRCQMPVIWHFHNSGSLDQSVGIHVGSVGAKWCLQQKSQGPSTGTERLQCRHWLTHCRVIAVNQGETLGTCTSPTPLGWWGSPVNKRPQPDSAAALNGPELPWPPSCASSIFSLMITEKDASIFSELPGHLITV